MCHSVLYKQLSAWMLHGMLLDDYEEFFVSNRPIEIQAEVSSADDDSQSQPQSGVVIRGVTGRELNKMRVNYSALFTFFCLLFCQVKEHHCRSQAFVRVFFYRVLFYRVFYRVF